MSLDLYRVISGRKRRERENDGLVKRAKKLDKDDLDID